MKVLFAVNNENISESILKKYQKDYKEVISYKNVYYFNAILKELQKDKTYDRIVISEDLEPFANNNYDIIDKFLFEKLDKISDEATDNGGNDIPIILICTDRRSKSDGILVKLFGIGIYSAIIGQDRSIDEVCRLIYMPRSKKEAKQYYRIEVDEVTYQTENESDVSEIEIQNILAHYKRLGKNTDRYVDSFNNIAAQYTDSQLKVIAKFLPLNVKAVLEADSPKYQEIMTTKVSSKKQTVKYGTTIKNQTKNKSKKEEMALDAFETKIQPTNLENPVVIPSAMNTAKPVKLQSNPQPQVEKSQGNEEIVEPKEMPVKKGRGRPKKIETIEQVDVLPQPKRGRGRPKKQEAVEEEPINLFDIQKEPDEEEGPIRTFSQETEENPINLFDMEEETEEVEEGPKVQQNQSNFTNSILGNVMNDVNDTENQTFINRSNSKINIFVGTSKNGTSFLVNNLGLMYSSMGINTAILDLTTNKNAYYIFTKNEEQLRQIASNSMRELEEENAKGIQVNNSLTVYTSLPGKGIDQISPTKVLQTLSNHYSLVLIDSDFNTSQQYFKYSDEIYLVQSMDILTIQPFTAFLRDLKTNGILEEQKLRIVINKYQKMKNLSEKLLIGGMSSYNDPAMSFMTELFNKDRIKYVTIPFDEDVYRNYLEGIVICDISTKDYTKSFKEALKELGNLVYPVYSSYKKQNYSKPNYNKYNGTKFNSNMDNTLQKMRNKY